MSTESAARGDAPVSPVPRRTGLLIATVFGLQFLVGLDMSLVNIALPDAKADLGFTDAGLQWVVTAYLLCFAGFLLVGGRLGDIWGRRTVIITGLTSFAVASAIGGLAQTPGLLVGARAAQGLAGALIAPAALALVATIADEDRRRRAMAVWGAASAAGGAVGVVASGLLTEAFSWRAVMFVNIPIIALVLASALASVPRGDRRDTQIDLLGGVLVTVGLGALIYAVTATGEYGWTSARALIGFVVAVVLLLGFAATERASDHPMMPIRVLATRSIVGANVFGFMLAAGQLAAFYFCSLYLQQVWALTPRAAGVLFLPFCFFVVVGIAAATKLAKTYGPRKVIVVFGLIGAAGLAMFSRLPDTYDFWLGMFVPSVVTAIGIGGSMMLIGVAGTTGVGPDDAGIASGVLNSSRQLGGTIGLAVLVTIAAQYSVAADGFRTGLAMAAWLLVAASAAAWLILPRDRAAHVE
ncbi:putative drug resistance efflux protein [Gordonia araii NBRC 100433]|uniref:Putative drug resistance efflux protein n=1 Tax=Gordonia araii NBRC 100433 TaxID=1073574 RepID=G7H3T7_9ACTN|nr:MFS transporter [Gordonia araii]NNG98667.1 MFS transporter [Gordonia araii NBRC 100433]GAB10512.1 putative drug resistance efflux protein [Gordonia araii NBRC 100433]